MFGFKLRGTDICLIPYTLKVLLVIIYYIFIIIMCHDNENDSV